MKKGEKIQFIYIITYFILLFSGLVLLLIFPKYALIPFICVLVFGYLGLGLVRSKTNTYTCPKCQHKFSINLFKDLFSKSGGTLGKKLKCPSCGNVEYMPEETK